MTVFTAGVAAGGWAAFTGVNSIGSFFGAVGSTMANGWTAIGNFVSGNGFGLNTGAQATQASVASAAESTGVLAADSAASTGAMAGTAAEAGGVTLPTLSAGNAAAAGVQAGATSPLITGVNAGAPLVTKAGEEVSKGFLSKLATTFTSDSVAGTFLRQGVMGGIMGYYEEKDRERQEFYFRNRTVWGNAAFGSKGESLIMPTAKKKSIFERTPQEEQQIAQQQQQAPTAEQTFGQGNLLTPEQQVQSPAQQAQRSAQAQMPQPTQPPPTNRPPVNRGLLFTPENEGIYNAV